MDGSLRHIELFDQYYCGDIDFHELVQEVHRAGLCPDWPMELELYLLAVDCINLNCLRQEIISLPLQLNLS